MMKLSEAIRVGSKMRAASERGWNDADSNGEIRTCALTAAAEGAGLFTILNNRIMIPGPNWIPPVKENGPSRDETMPSSISSRIPNEWALVTSREELPPCECRAARVPDSVMLLIWHLHDVHRWSREAVAEWVETLENKVEIEIAQQEARRLEIARDLEADLFGE